MKLNNKTKTIQKLIELEINNKGLLLRSSKNEKAFRQEMTTLELEDLEKYYRATNISTENKNIKNYTLEAIGIIAQ